MLAALSVLALLAAAPPGSSPLEGCGAQPIEGGWSYRCEGLLVNVEDRVLTPAQFLRYFDGAIEGLIGTAKARKIRERRVLRGSSADVVRLELEGTGKRIVVAAVPVPPGARMIVCASGAPDHERCDRALQWLASAPWKSGPVAGTVSVPQRTIALAGREVAVPAGCQAAQSVAGSQITCDSKNWVKWNTGPEAIVVPLVDKAEAMFTQELERLELTVAREVIPCRIAGIPSRCRRLRVSAEGEQGMTCLVGAVPVDGRYLLAMCLSYVASGTPVPCSLVVDTE